MNSRVRHCALSIQGMFQMGASSDAVTFIALTLVLLLINSEHTQFQMAMFIFFIFR